MANSANIHDDITTYVLFFFHFSNSLIVATPGDIILKAIHAGVGWIWLARLVCGGVREIGE